MEKEKCKEEKCENKCQEECTCEKECDCEEKCNCEGKCNCDDKKHEGKHKKDKHLDKLNEAYNMISSLEDKLLREKAEMINYRKRKDDEQARLLKYANEDIVKELLEIVDNFERALDYKIDNENMEGFLNGFKMIYASLVSILEKFEVKAVDGKDKPFDPTYHQAVMTEHVDNVEPGMVVDVLRKGYILKDKVIRPAMVKVSE